MLSVDGVLFALAGIGAATGGAVVMVAVPRLIGRLLRRDRDRRLNGGE